MERQPQPHLIEMTPEHTSQLQSLVHPYMELERKGYIMSQLSKEDLDRKRRCAQCNKTLSVKTLKFLNAPSLAAVRAAKEFETANADGATIPDLSGTGQLKGGESAGSRPKLREPRKQCSFHSGTFIRNRQMWSCCSGHMMAKPCHEEEKHVQIAYPEGELESNWIYTYTPPRRAGTATPLVAVAVDCEMGTAESGESELIRVSMIDYFTGAVLLDKLVWPDVPMAHYNTRWSGVTRQAMNQARRDRTCLLGRRGARMAIFEFVGPETVVIGHALNSDLTSLRWIHHRVVDTLMVEDPFARADRARVETAHAEALQTAMENEQPAPPPPKPQHPGCSLKALTKAYLNRNIQVGKKGHDSLEDAMATRDLLHWHINNRLPKLTPELPADETIT